MNANFASKIGGRSALSRRMLVVPVLALLAALLAACAGPDYGAYLGRFVGLSESALADRWGPPDWRNPAADGSAELHYIYQEPELELLSADGGIWVRSCLTTFRVAPRPGANRDGGPGAAGRSVVQRSVARRSMVRQSVVESWRYAGNYCVTPVLAPGAK